MSWIYSFFIISLIYCILTDTPIRYKRPFCIIETHITLFKYKNIICRWHIKRSEHFGIGFNYNVELERNRAIEDDYVLNKHHIHMIWLGWMWFEIIYITPYKK